VCWKPCSSCRSSHLIREEFLSASIHSPLSGSPYRSFRCASSPIGERRDTRVSSSAVERRRDRSQGRICDPSFPQVLSLPLSLSLLASRPTVADSNVVEVSPRASRPPALAARRLELVLLPRLLPLPRASLDLASNFPQCDLLTVFDGGSVHTEE
jgi:hypothetical protein